MEDEREFLHGRAVEWQRGRRRAVQAYSQRDWTAATDLAPKFYPVLNSLQRFLIAVFGAVAAGCGAEPFRLRSTASRRGLMV